MTDQNVLLTHDNNVSIITLNNPDTLNALGPEVVAEIKEALKEIASPGSKTRCLVITGSGRGFSSGASLTGSMSSDEDALDLAELLEKNYHPIMRSIQALDIPVITAINGIAAGVGMSLALMGDLILAGRSAYFLQAFTRIGLVPDAGSSWLLPRLIGLARARELSILAEKLPAEKALEWGLINRVYDDEELMPEALKLAHQLAAGPTQALGQAHKLYAATGNNNYEEQLQMEREAQQKLGYSADFKEGVTAFLEKRPANFKGE